MSNKNSPGNNDPARGLWAGRLNYFESRTDALVQAIREFVEIESPSDNKLAADRMGALLAAKFEGAGGHAQIHRAEEFGDNVPEPKGQRLMLA